jgi:hypothetical protein
MKIWICLPDPAADRAEQQKPVSVGVTRAMKQTRAMMMPRCE